ncbi:tetratricopeptide repeat protein [Constantimarinum furrinae]|uniref:TonB-dependent Receptor n=1 Tax=Constantimarinum furrinae TaxID=2562285 RepID=A0A7G8PXU0_9FLAO|nr:tetratricopeptide repeat protein [Constantimarinum furrinae]QNJ99156.1 TonB-dependent Receptor [Constantimarinum furrinae]
MKTLITSLLCLLVFQLSGQTFTVSGTVTDSNNMPLLGANISISGTKTGVQTDYDGNFSIAGKKGQELVFSFVGMKPFKMEITKTESVEVVLEEKAEALDPIVIGVYGIPKDYKRRPYAVTEISGTEIENKPQADVSRALVGKIPGAQITATSGVSGSGTNFTIRSMSSITGSNQPLFVIDGMPINTSTNAQGGFEGGVTVVSSRIMDIDPNNIKKVKVLKGLSAAVLYGEQGRNGVVLITTKTGDFSDQELAPELPYGERILEEQERLRTKLANERTAVEQGYKSPFQSSVITIINSVKKYETYLKEQERYGSNPAFYIDVYNRFKKADSQLASKILEGFVNVNANKRQLLKVLAFKLEEEGRFDLAVSLYKKIHKNHPNDPSAIRDLALAMQATDQSDVADELLKSAIAIGDSRVKNSSQQSFSSVLRTELANMLSSEEIQNKKEIRKQYTTADLRIVMDWNRPEIDLNMIVVDPNLEEISLENPKSSSGGIMLGNHGASMGPETFLLEHIQSGSYYIKVGEGPENAHELRGDVFVKLTIFRNFGKPDQTREIQVIKVTNIEDNHLMERIAVL